MFKKHHPRAGARPGTLIIPGDSPRPILRRVRYGRDAIRDEILAIDRIGTPDGTAGTTPVTWIDVQGLGDAEVLARIAETFGLHPLAIEDIVNVPQRPKADHYADQLLIISRLIRLDEDRGVSNRQVSIVVGPHYVLSFQQDHHDLFAPVRRRIENDASRLRAGGPDYLAYALLDTVVDAYYPALESIGERLELLEELIIERPTPALLREVNLIKGRLTNVKRSIWPQREALRQLAHDDSRLIGENVRLFLRDTYDHCIQTSEVVEMYRETATGQLNMYLSSVGQRTNEVMKALTVMASIFIPLTFVAGIYGMNFENMPELRWKWSYPLVWTIMLIIVGGMLWYFRTKGWIGTEQLDVEAALRAAAERRIGQGPDTRTDMVGAPHDSADGRLSPADAA